MGTLTEGVYLELFHGRKSPHDELADWGTDGPIFGPYPFIHTTYGATIRLGDAHMLGTVADLVYYDGMYYGDWTVTASVPEGLEPRHVDFDEKKAGG